MRYKKTLISIILLIIVLPVCIFIFKGVDKDKSIQLTEETSSKLQKQQNASTTMLLKSWNNQTLYTPVNTVEGSKDEYVTYYFYKTAFLLGHKPTLNYYKTTLDMLKSNSFSKEEGDLIFTGIERVYRTQKLLELDEKNLNSSSSLMKNHTKYLINTTFMSEGYFISNEFNEYRNTPEYLDVEIQQTFMMLYLATEYGLIKDVELNKIESWVDSIDLNNDPIRIEKVVQINEMLNRKSKLKINPSKIRKLIYHDSYNFNDILTINSITNLYLDKIIKLTHKEISAINSRLKSSYFNDSDIQSQYYKLDSLKKLGVSISTKENDMELKKINYFIDNNNGMLPTISSYNNPFSILLIGRYAETTTGFKSNLHDVKILKYLNKIKASELIKQDALEIYSYTSLFQLSDKKMETNNRKTLINYLLKKIKVPIDQSNVMDWSFYIKSLVALNIDLSSDMLSENTQVILDKIIKDQKSVFGNNTEISTLAFLEALSNANLSLEKIKQTKTFIDNVKIDTHLDTAPYLIYYKTALLEETSLPYDKNELAEPIAKLFKHVGYALNDQKQFYDVYSTFFIMQANQLLLEEGK